MNPPSTSASTAPYGHLFPSETARNYFMDPSPNILVCGLPRSGKTSIIKVIFYKVSPHETLSYLPSSSSCVHSICHTPFSRCTLIDVVGVQTPFARSHYPSISVSPSLSSPGRVEKSFYPTYENESRAYQMATFALHSSTGATSPSADNLSPDLLITPSHPATVMNEEATANDGNLNANMSQSYTSFDPYISSPSNQSADASPRWQSPHSNSSSPAYTAPADDYADSSLLQPQPSVFSGSSKQFLDDAIADDNPHTISVAASSLVDPATEKFLFCRVSSVIYVVDAQNGHLEYDIANAKDIFKKAWTYNQNVKFEVFIHKIDGDIFATDDVRTERQRRIHDKLMTDLDQGKVKKVDVMFYSTSIYDHTIYEAISRVMQNLSTQLNAYVQLLDTLVSKCKMERAFLMDTYIKSFLATDSSLFDPCCFELCSEMIDVMMELSRIYGETSDDSPLELKDSVEEKVNSDSTALISAGDGNQSISKEDGPSAMCLISLTSGHILYLKEIHRFISLACVIRDENFDRQYLVDYNIRIFKSAVEKLMNQN